MVSAAFFVFMRKFYLRLKNWDIYAKSSFVEKYAWQLDNVEVFDKQIDAKGKLSLWEYEI